MRVLNEKERAIITSKLKLFGFTLGGGSCETDGDGQIVYHVSIEKGSTATYDVKKMGTMLKEILGADKVFDSGVLLA